MYKRGDFVVVLDPAPMRWLAGAVVSVGEFDQEDVVGTVRVSLYDVELAGGHGRHRFLRRQLCRLAAPEERCRHCGGAPDWSTVGRLPLMFGEEAPVCTCGPKHRRRDFPVQP
jgi:hypothetical protein